MTLAPASAEALGPAAHKAPQRKTRRPSWLRRIARMFRSSPGSPSGAEHRLVKRHSAPAACTAATSGRKIRRQRGEQSSPNLLRSLAQQTRRRRSCMDDPATVAFVEHVRRMADAPAAIAPEQQHKGYDKVHDAVLTAARPVPPRRSYPPIMALTPATLAYYAEQRLSLPEKIDRWCAVTTFERPAPPPRHIGPDTVAQTAVHTAVTYSDGQRLLDDMRWRRRGLFDSAGRGLAQVPHVRGPGSPQPSQPHASEGMAHAHRAPGTSKVTPSSPAFTPACLVRGDSAGSELVKCGRWLELHVTKLSAMPSDDEPALPRKRPSEPKYVRRKEHHTQRLSRRRQSSPGTVGGYTRIPNHDADLQRFTRL